jgi:hypothetical protein
MKKIFLKNIVLIITIAGMFYACRKKDVYPVEPEIKFENFITIYNYGQSYPERGVLVFSFTDGDGDIGLFQDDTIPPYDYNLFISYFEIQNGDTIEVFLTQTDPATGDVDTLNFNGRIPILTPFGSNKSISGEVEDTIFIHNPASPFDTIMFKAYIVDRALHHSNTITTPLIVR